MSASKMYSTEVAIILVIIVIPIVITVAVHQVTHHLKAVMCLTSFFMMMGISPAGVSTVLISSPECHQLTVGKQAQADLTDIDGCYLKEPISPEAASTKKVLKPSAGSSARKAISPVDLLPLNAGMFLVSLDTGTICTEISQHGSQVILFWPIHRQMMILLHCSCQARHFTYGANRRCSKTSKSYTQIHAIN